MYIISWNDLLEDTTTEAYAKYWQNNEFRRLIDSIVNILVTIVLLCQLLIRHITEVVFDIGIETGLTPELYTKINRYANAFLRYGTSKADT